LHGARAVSRKLQCRWDFLKFLSPKRSLGISAFTGEMLTLPQGIVSILDQKIG
jgi:hypothetical protein